MRGVRRRLHHRWIPYLAAALAGLVIAGSVSAVWQRTFSQPAVVLLGSGHGLSALVSTGSARVLIVAGDDPIAFANALTDARPPTMRRIDVVVLTPGASPLVAARAVELADPARIMAIEPIVGNAENNPLIDEPIRVVSAPRTIDLRGELLLDIDPGFITGQPSSGWSIRVQSRFVSVLLSESVPFRPGPAVGLVAIMGSTLPDAIHSLTIPVAVAADITERPSGTYGLIEPGEAQRIPIESASIKVPREWIPPTETPSR